MTNFLPLNATTGFGADPPLRSTYGDLEPVRVTTNDAVDRTFVYPSNAEDPAVDPFASFILTNDGFHSALGRVSGDIYEGRTSAGRIGDHAAGVKFDRVCGFILRLQRGNRNRS